jgi:hypothetical protein
VVTAEWFRYGGGVEWIEVGVAAHEAHPLAVLHNGDGVAGEQGATTVGSGWPVQHGGTVEVPADPSQGQARDRRYLVIIPERDAG